MVETSVKLGILDTVPLNWLKAFKINTPLGAGEAGGWTLANVTVGLNILCSSLYNHQTSELDGYLPNAVCQVSMNPLLTKLKESDSLDVAKKFPPIHCPVAAEGWWLWNQGL